MTLLTVILPMLLQAAPPVMVVFETAAGNFEVAVDVAHAGGLRLVWPGSTAAAAVGKVMNSSGEAPFTIIGVVADVWSSPRRPPTPMLYVPLDATKFRFAYFLARTSDGRSPSVVDVRNRIKAAGITPTSVTIHGQEQQLSDQRVNDCFRAVLLGGFGLVALALAVIGLYAVASFEAELQRREMGIRLSLGARRGDVARRVMADAVRPAGIGVAAWIPARRAARTDPAVVLRSN